jgi:type IV pilus assembly protein PilE
MNDYQPILTAPGRCAGPRTVGAFAMRVPPLPAPPARVAPAGRRVQAGFTGIEMMIVVAIVAILAAIALPTYSNYVRRGKVAEVTSVLGTGRVNMEQFFLDNRTYASGPCPASTAYFTISCGSGASAPDATTYTITATGSGDMSGFVYTVNQANAKTTAGPWVSGTQPCWVFRKGDSC